VRRRPKRSFSLVSTALCAGAVACTSGRAATQAWPARAPAIETAPPQAPPSPRALAQEGCKREDAALCLELGELLLADATLDLRRQGEALLDFRCMAGFPAACTALGVFYAQHSPADAARYALRACELAEPVGCTLTGALLEIGSPDSPDPLGAGAFYELACTNGHMPACQALARLRLTHSDLESIEKETDPLLPRLDAACEAGSPIDCGLAAYLYRSAAGESAAGHLADLRLAAACRLGLAWACGSADGLPPPSTPDPLQALLAGAWRPNPELARLKVDHERALESLEDLCRDGATAACLMLARESLDRRRRAAELYDAACILGHLPSCALLGGWLYAGDGLSLDRDRGKALIRQACHGGVDAACDQLEALGIPP
jgi:TPR repeat protein